MKIHEIFGIVLLFMASLFMDALMHGSQKVSIHWAEIVLFIGVALSGVALLLKEVECEDDI